VPVCCGTIAVRDPDEKSVIDVIDVLAKVTLWLVASLFVHVTVLPGETVIVDGLNCNPLIVTAVVATGVPVVVLGDVEESPPHPANTASAASIMIERPRMVLPS
jgi:hypothetical protein